MVMSCLLLFAVGRVSLAIFLDFNAVASDGTGALEPSITLPSIVEAFGQILRPEPAPSSEELVAALEREGPAIVLNLTKDLPPPTHFTNAQLLSCLDGVHLRGFGDSHGRDVMQSPLLRFGLQHKDHQRDWTHEFPPAPQTAIGSIGHKYQGTPLRTEVVKLRNRNSTHVLISRGTWDAMKFSTTQEGYFGAVSSLLYTAGSLMPDVASITFKPVHFFHEPGPDLVFFGACTNRTIVAAYRRTAACAVAWHNRNVRLRERQGPLVWLFDAFDMVSSFSRASKASDGHHLVNDYLHAVTDRYLHAVVCPAKWSKTEDDLPLPSAEAFISRSEEDISHRFSCHEVFEALGLEGNVTTKPPKARKKHGNTAPSAPKVRRDKLGFSVRQDKPGALERLMNLGPRPACRCENPDDRLNDDCAPLSC
jgi:hypothetical protein